jgi:hypothetical protein
MRLRYLTEVRTVTDSVTYCPTCETVTEMERITTPGATKLLCGSCLKSWASPTLEVAQNNCSEYPEVLEQAEVSQ